MLIEAPNLHPAWGEDAALGLQRFAEPPDWLLALKDAERVSEGLRAWVPELSSGEIVLGACEVLRVRMRDGRWTAQYRLELEGRPGARTVELAAHYLPEDASNVPAPGTNAEPFASPQWSCYVPELRLRFELLPADAALTSLPALTDPDEARTILERCMRSASSDYADLRIESCEPRIMRYKPGRRCTVLYELTYGTEGDGRDWPNPVIAKTHHGIKGRNAHESMRALWDSPLRDSNTVTIAEPLGFLPDLNIVLQGPIKEDVTLKKQLRRSIKGATPEEVATIELLLSKTARGLAELHGCGVADGRLVTFEDQLEEVKGRVARLDRFVPGLDDAARALLGRLEDIDRAYPADPPVPSHRSFRPAQVLIHGSDIGFIDFDSFCQAEPALDIALFLSVLRDLCVRALQDRDGRPAPGEGVRDDHLALIDRLSDTFVEAYEEAASTTLSHARVDLWHALEVFSRVVNCWMKDRPERLQHCMALLTHLYAKDGLTKLVA